jgi:hypothetical protein
MNTNCGEVSRLLKLDAYQTENLIDTWAVLCYILDELIF